MKANTIVSVKTSTVVFTRHLQIKALSGKKATYILTMTYSVCVQYSHATIDLILMAVDEKDIEH